MSSPMEARGPWLAPASNGEVRPWERSGIGPERRPTCRAGPGRGTRFRRRNEGALESLAISRVPSWPAGRATRDAHRAGRNPAPRFRRSGASLCEGDSGFQPGTLPVSKTARCLRRVSYAGLPTTLLCPTGSASPPVLVDVRVRIVIDVTMRTVVPRSIFPAHVLCARHQLQMVGPHADPVAAQVVDCHPRRDGLSQHLPCEPMNVPEASKVPVAAPVHGPHPNPTIPLEVNSIPQPVRVPHRGIASHDHPPSSVTRLCSSSEPRTGPCRRPRPLDGRRRSAGTG